MGNQLICGSKFDNYSVDNMNKNLVNEDIIVNQLENNVIINETNKKTIKETIDYIIERPAIKWPRKKVDWEPVILKINNYLKEYEDCSKPVDNIRKLTEEIYAICKTEFGIIRRHKRTKIETKYSKRDKIINEFKNIRSGMTNSGNKQEEIADYFQTINSLKSKKDEICKINKTKKPIKAWQDFDKTPITESEFKTILETKINNRSNYDGLSYEVIRKCPNLANKLVSIYNQILKEKKLPEDWHYCFVYETYKGKGNKEDVKNYRSIVRFDTFSKLYWHLINSKIKKHVINKGILNTTIQKAFLDEVRGTEENLFIHQQVKPKSKVVIYLDIKNAYGSINAKFLSKVLKYNGISKNIRKQIKNFIRNRKVIYGKECREWNTGLPQGLPISNYLFIICMNYIIDDFNRKYIEKHGVNIDDNMFFLQAFADDLSIYINDTTNFQRSLDELISQFNKAGLNIQATKSFIDYVDKSEMSTSYKINGVDIPNITTSPKFKYLGQYANLDIVWTTFANDVKTSLEAVKTKINNELEEPNKKDYWFAYYNIWKFRINWFLRVNDITPEKCKIIEDVEKAWFRSIECIKDIADNTSMFEDRRLNMSIVRFSCLNNSKDSRIVSLYKSSMGDRYESVKKNYEKKFDGSLVTNTGFKKCVYNNIS